MKVSVVMITYLQEKYIEEAMMGVLNQKCSFDVELIVANDNSPDSTHKIIEAILSESNFPHNLKIRYLNNEVNKGMMPNFIWAMKHASGTYIAICDGDDFWTDPLKLQKQVDFLEGNPDYSICFHNVEEVNKVGIISDKRLVQSSEIEETYTIEDLARNNFIHTTTVVFRKNITELPEFLKFSPMGDYPLHMINATLGKIKYFPQKMAAYRVGAGIWSSQSINNQILNTIVGLKLMITYFSSFEKVVENLEEQIKNLTNSFAEKTSMVDPEKLAYNLSFKKLIIILLKKLKHSF